MVDCNFNIDDYKFKPVLKPDWFLLSTSLERFDMEREYYVAMAQVMRVVRADKEDWEKLVELCFHEFNINLMLQSNVLFDYKYDVYDSKKADFVFDCIAESKINPSDFIYYMDSLRNSLEDEIAKISIRVSEDLRSSGLLFVVNDTNSFIHTSSNVTPVFYKNTSDEISMFRFSTDDGCELLLNYSNVVNISGEDCAKKFIKFVKNKSSFFDKSTSMIIYTMPDYDIKHAAGLFYAVYILNAWINGDTSFDSRVLDITSNLRGLDHCLSFSVDM